MIEPIYKRIGERLKAVRNQHIAKPSLADVAFSTNLSHPAISNIENGKRRVTIHTLERICVALGIDIGEVLKP